MVSNNLIKFERSGDVSNEHTADFGEKLGDAGMGLLRSWGGKTVNVVQSGNDVKFEEHPNSTLSRIAVIVLSILLIPVTLVMTGVGSIAYKCSTSHKKIGELYRDDQITKANDIIQPTEHESQPLSLEDRESLFKALTEYQLQTGMCYPGMENHLCNMSGVNPLKY